MDSFKTLLKKFDLSLQKYNHVNYARLQNPLPEQELDQFLKELEINDENFKQLYKWKNGFNSTHGENRHNQIFDFGGLLSMEFLLESKALDLGAWEKSFVPLVSTGDGDFILFNNKNGREYGKLHLFSPSLLYIEEPIGYYDSIYTLIETTIEAYQQHVFEYDEKKDWLDIDINKLDKIVSKLNKYSEFWKLDK